MKLKFKQSFFISEVEKPSLFVQRPKRTYLFFKIFLTDFWKKYSRIKIYYWLCPLCIFHVVPAVSFWTSDIFTFGLSPWILQFSFCETGSIYFACVGKTFCLDLDYWDLLSHSSLKFQFLRFSWYQTWKEGGCCFEKSQNHRCKISDYSLLKLMSWNRRMQNFIKILALLAALWIFMLKEKFPLDVFLKKTQVIF